MLLAESGSTKTEWRLFQGEQLQDTFRTSGFNPNVQDEAHIQAQIAALKAAHFQERQVEAVFFYGAGIGGDSQKRIMQELIQDAFPRADVHIYHDILAAARSTGRQAGIVCILGTGSNSCSYADGEILQNLGGHGYLFGDEGSGADLGRALVRGILLDEFPIEAKRIIEQHESKSIYEMKISVHHAEKPNVRMAELAKLIDPVLHLAEVREMVKQRFLLFLDTTVCRYPDYQNRAVDFVGSVGFYFRDILREACQERGFEAGQIIKDPIQNLIRFHLV